MLQHKTIEPGTLQLLKELQSLPLLQETRLVGGTALALQLGHRSSVDLDLFGTIPFSADEIRDALSENHSLTIVKESKNINSYFEDAEPDPMPMMFDEVSWETVKQSVRDAIASL